MNFLCMEQVLPNGEMSTGNKAPVLDMMISGVFPGQDLEQQTSESLATAKPSGKMMLKCKPSAHYACAVSVIDGLGLGYHAVTHGLPESLTRAS